MIDWQKLILNLRSAGLSTLMVSKRANMDAQTVTRFARGELKEPRFSQGLALLDLHLIACPEKHQEIRL